MKTIRVFILLLCVSWSRLGLIVAEENGENGKPIFVSLGSHCEVASVLTHLKFRHASYPLDWLLTFDYAGFLLLLEEDFAHFMDTFYLSLQPAGDVLNTRYQIYLRHDWPDRNFEQHLPEVQTKYLRRIARFNNLIKANTKVFFIRSAFDLSLGPDLPAVTPECCTIAFSHAEALRDMLDKKFPGLDFQLVIVNYVEENTAPIVGLERVIEIKIRKTHKIEDYSRFLNDLVDEQS